MSGIRPALLAAICLSFFADNAVAQPRGGVAERDRGLLGRVGARRDERLNRNAPAPGTPNANAQAGPRGPAAVGGNPYNTPATNPSSYGRSQANASARTGIAPNLTLPNNAYNNRAGQAGSQPSSNNQRSAYYSPSANAELRRSAPNNPYSVAGSQASSQVPRAPTTAPVPPAPPVQTASATAPVNKLPYKGPGVLVRLPESVAGEVNYLVDDSEHLIVHSGEAQLLHLKGSYEVRFSRGVTSEGRSYGEARYTITEGVYRFDVAANGWELYREGEARDVEAAVSEARKPRRDDDGPKANAKEQAESSSLPPLLAPRTQPRFADEFENKEDEDKKSDLPSPTPPTTEETLPAPKSILDPS